MKFCEVCEQDSHRDTILNLAHQLFVAKEEEELAHQMAQEATEKRMKLEQDLCYFTGIVVGRNPELMKKVNGVHSKDESVEEEGES